MNLITRLIHTTLILLLAWQVSGQQMDHFRKLTVANGLSNASVRLTYQDCYDFIWIGTRSGLNRYDGHVITIMDQQGPNLTEFINEDISTILQVNKSELWLGTETGIFIYQYESGTIMHHPDPTFTDRKINDIKLDIDSSIWIATYEGLFHLTGDSIVSYVTNESDPYSLSNNIVRSILVVDSVLYAATPNGLNILNKNTQQFTNPHNNDHPVFKEAGIYTYQMIFSSDGELWFGSFKDDSEPSINRYNPTTKQLKRYTIGDNGLDFFYTILAIHEDDQGIFIGVNGGGFYQYDPVNDHFNHYNYDPKDPNSISDIDVWGIMRDRNDNLWISTDGGGVNQYHPFYDRFQLFNHNPYDQKTIGVNDTYGFYEDDTHLWVATNTLGLSKMNLQTGEFYNFPFNLDDPDYSVLDYTVLTIAGDEYGQIWLGTYSEGVSVYNPESNTFKHIRTLNAPDFPKSTYCTSILPLGALIYIGTENGLSIYNQKTEQLQSFHLIENTNTSELPIVEDLMLDADNLLWCATNLGVRLFDPQTNQAEKTNTVLDSLSSFSIAQAREDVWVGTNKGLVRVNKQGQAKVYTMEDGLSHLTVMGVVITPDGTIWCTTSKGLSSFDPVFETFTNFHRIDGLQGDQFNPGSIHLGASGTLYAGGPNGFNSWDPKSIQLDMTKPEVHFTEVKLQHDNQVISQSLSNKNTIELSDEDDYVTVHFFSSEIISSEKVKFEYKIDEFSTKGWIKTDDWNVTLTDLRPGKYTLDVRAGNYDGRWGQPTALGIVVKPPFYASRIAYIVYGALLVLLMFGRDRYLKYSRKKLEITVQERTKELRLQKEKAILDTEIINKQRNKIEQSLKEREALLKEIHHRVKNNLQIIASLLYLQSGKFENEDFKQVLQEGQGRVRSMALIHQKLYENEDLKSIVFDEYLPELLQEIRSSFGASAKAVDIKIDCTDVLIDVETAIPIGLIINELTTNSFKYAFDPYQAGTLQVSMRNVDDKIILDFYDNGKGIPQDFNINKTRSLGLRLVKMLCIQLEADYLLEPDNGTHFQMSLRV